MIKVFFKEDWIPPFADKAVFVIAPAVIVVVVLLSFTVVPMAPGVQVVDLNVGLLFFLAMSSLGVYSVALAGWASASKYSLLGGLRASAQMLSYEVFMGLSLMGVMPARSISGRSSSHSAGSGIWSRNLLVSWSSSSQESPKRTACPLTCPRPRANWSRVFTRNTLA